MAFLVDDYLHQMGTKHKNQRDILDKLGIEQLNAMQEEAKLAIHSTNEVILLSPTGTGKTLAFLLPIIAEIDRSLTEIQCLILVPSRDYSLTFNEYGKAELWPACKIASGG